jgi:primary-amine oxidase
MSSEPDYSNRQRWTHRVAIALLLLVGLSQAGLAASHPLDPLSADEIRSATQLIRMDARLSAGAITFMTVEEPPKSEVLAWLSRSGESAKNLTRRARAVLSGDSGVFEVTVDLDAKKLVSVIERKGLEGPVTGTEARDLSRIALADSKFQNSLTTRGISDFTKIFCAPFTAGYFGIPEHEGKRILMATCFDTRKSTNNTWGWPIERLYAAVDVRARKVIEVVDYGIVPVSASNQNFRQADIEAVRPAQKPTLLTQPEGANYQIEGNEVRWGNWMFHVRVDPRVGPVISLARWRDGERYRSILYQGNLSEMFVPYMDPDVGWYSRTYFDAGEYGAGLMASQLKAGVDCPVASAFLPATFNNDRGPYTTPNALCIFERDRGEPIWRHGGEGRKDVELVVRMTATVGNYDYLLDWVFNDAAEIEVRVGATGIVALKGVPAQNMSDATAAQDTRFGALVAPGLVATNHDHFFNFRLDMDVDGPENSLTREVYEKAELPASSPRRSVYTVRPQRPETEKDAQFNVGHADEKFLIVNERKTNDVGNSTAFELAFANHARLLLDPEDWPARRARFLEHDLWVTPLNPPERYAAGDYVFASRAPDGLPVWTAQNRKVRSQDIVVWVNLGMHHLTRAEDQPVMPTVWHSFKLRPMNFFNRNPALDLRP